MGYIGSHGVAALHRYKYSGVDHSYLAKYVLLPFWTRFVHFFPLWMPYTHLNWTRLFLDGFILHMGYFCFYTRLSMPLMGSKLDEQILQAHWGSCLIVDVMHLLVLLKHLLLGAHQVFSGGG